jgi:hypothetical protein
MRVTPGPKITYSVYKCIPMRTSSGIPYMCLTHKSSNGVSAYGLIYSCLNMKTQKRARVISSANTGIVVSDGMRRGFRFDYKMWGIGLLVLGVIGMAVAVVTHLDADHRKSTTEDPVHNKAGLADASPAKGQSASSQAQSFELNGHQSAAQQLLDTAISHATNTKQEGALYEEKANLAYGAGEYTQSIQYAQKAENLSPTVNRANWIASNAQVLGQNSLAVKYYKLELQRLGKSPDSQVQGGDTADIDAKIQALGGA